MNRVRAWLTEARYVSQWAPVVSIIFIDAANLGHVWRMFAEGTAAGQSLLAWSSVLVALASWLNFYTRVTPGKEGRVARLTTVFGMVVVAVIISTIVWLRYIA